MPSATHCLPAGSLPANALSVPGIPGWGSVQVPATVAGVCLYLPGLATEQVMPPVVPVDTGGILPVFAGTLIADLLADDWVVITISAPENQFSGGVPQLGLLTDVQNDAAFGARYLATVLALHDHAVRYAAETWPGKKLMAVGLSRGGWAVYQLLAHRLSTLIGAIAHVPATIWSNVNPTFTAPVSFAGVNTTGMDAGPTILNSVGATPVLVSYGTNDVAVGWQNPGGTLPTSNTDAIITNAQTAGANVFRNATTDNHELLVADVTTFQTWWTTHVDPLR